MAWIHFAVAIAFFPHISERLLGHGDVHERIDALTAGIRMAPTNALLYVRRGELWRLHGEWRKALADFDRAKKRDPGLAGIDFARGRACLEAGRLPQAVQALERCVAREPDRAEGWALLGRARVRRGEWLEGADDFDKALALEAKGDPDWYLERARALRAAGREHGERALQGLDAGMDQLGRPAALQLAAIELEAELGRVDAAVIRLEGALAGAARKEIWLVRKGEVLERAGRVNEARGCYEQALVAIGFLPVRIRELSGTGELADRVRAGLERLAGGNSTGEVTEGSSRPAGRMEEGR